MEDLRTTPKGNRIEAVLFDYGQVLSQGPNPEAWSTMQRSLKADADTFHMAYWTPRHDYDRGALSGTDYWHKVSELAGHTGFTEAELDNLYAADVALWTDLNEPMLAWVKTLHTRGVRTGILSNIGDRMETGLRQRFDWIGNFSHCTWSHQLRMAKPERAIYEHAAKGLQTAPEHILFIDDREENIHGARAVGMTAIQYRTHNAFLQDMERAGLESLL